MKALLTITVFAMAISICFFYARTRVEKRSNLLKSALPQAGSSFTSIQSGLPQRPVQTSEALRHFLLSETSSVTKITNLSSADAYAVNSIYPAVTNLNQRRMITWVLGYIGNEQSVELLKSALFEEFAGRQLTSRQGESTDEEETLFWTVTSLGFLGQQHDSAYEVVRAGVDPLYWKTRARWSSKRGTDTFGILAGRSIQALACSDREDGWRLLQTIKDGPLVNVADPSPDSRTFNGDVAQAMFYRSIITEHGISEFRQMFFAGRVQHEFQEWVESEKGKHWMKWYEEKNKESTVRRF